MPGTHADHEQSLCYDKAVAQGIRTAKLPIGEYIKMSSRFVLTTNQVVEIMLKYLECRDWKEAFMEVIPQRKQPKLKPTQEETQGCGGGDEKARGVEEIVEGAASMPGVEGVEEAASTPQPETSSKAKR